MVRGRTNVIVIKIYGPHDKFFSVIRPTGSSGGSRWLEARIYSFSSRGKKRMSHIITHTQKEQVKKVVSKKETKQQQEEEPNHPRSCQKEDNPLALLVQDEVSSRVSALVSHGLGSSR